MAAVHGPFTRFPDTPQRVGDASGFQAADWPTNPAEARRDKDGLKAALGEHVDALHDLQRRLHAESRRALLVVFQAMDAGGKDSTVRAVFSGVNPTGVRVTSFKAPTEHERAHDFLWRTTAALPAAGQIGVFNRSHYEDVLIARVHPERAGLADDPALWAERLRSIAEYERHLAHNGTVVLKFWLHVSRRVQMQRFLKRLRRPEKHWKFDEADINERQHWPAYVAAYEAAIAATHAPWAPWYVVPADHKPAMRVMVAATVRRTLEAMDPRYPQVSHERAARLTELADALQRTAE